MRGFFFFSSPAYKPLGKKWDLQDAVIKEVFDVGDQEMASDAGGTGSAMGSHLMGLGAS